MKRHSYNIARILELFPSKTSMQILFSAIEYVRDTLHHFRKTEAFSSVVLVSAAAAAIVLTNFGAHEWYENFINMPLSLVLGPVALHKTLLLWVNDLLMAIFFFVIGLELKREFMEGHLSSADRVVLPAFAAAGGMLVPALIFASLNHHDPVAMRGWAIPTATDIAFSLGVLMMLGARVPSGLKVFLLAIAILDDLGAVLIIALYYSDDLSMHALRYAGLCLVLLIGLNRLKVNNSIPFLLVGLALWYFILKSGVHATMAGILLAMTIPTHVPHDYQYSPLTRLENHFHGWVAFGILPVFAFCNAGVYLLDTTFSNLGDTLTLGVLLGLLIGKPIGICLFAALAVALKLGSMPRGVNWPAFLGMSCLCGIGFTMSLFVSTLAHGNMPALIVEDKIGIVLGSLLSALIGFFILKAALGKPKAELLGTP